MTELALVAVAWLLVGLTIWIALIVDSRRLTVGDLFALPLWMLIGPLGLLFLTIVALMTSDTHIIAEWRKW